MRIKVTVLSGLVAAVGMIGPSAPAYAAKCDEPALGSDVTADEEACRVVATIVCKALAKGAPCLD